MSITTVERDDFTHPVRETETAVVLAKEDGRDYVVLKRVSGDSPAAPQTWVFISNVNATSAEQAVRRAAETPGTSFLNLDGPTTLVAVPARNFNPVNLTVRVETSIVLS